jgi:5'-methylthioadenosine phosphorylase
MEGPQFSTRAESRLYRSWGADVIGMTNLTEAKLAREAEICYATLALVTDWDAWRESEEAVSVETVLAILGENAAAARRTMREAVSRVAPDRDCACRRALQFGILTDPASIAPETRRRLEPLVGKYLDRDR